MKTPHECWTLAGGGTPAYSAERYRELCLAHGVLVPKRAPWFTGEGLCFDLETTGPEPFDARIVTATCVEICPKGVVQATEFMINPGVPIPEEASKIHGVTNEMVQANGRDPLIALAAIVAIIQHAWDRGLPLIAMNANYDLTVMVCELLRYLLPPLVIGPVLDPFVIDRGCDPYRQGKRTLTATCAHYGVKQEGAHSSTGDALAAGRLIWKLAGLATSQKKFQRLGKLTLAQMQTWQRKAHFDRQTNYEEYSRKNKRLGRDGLPEVVEKEWPVRGARELEAPVDPPFDPSKEIF